MIIAVLTINHHKTPVAIREKVALNKESSINLSNKLLQQHSINGVAILSTCNRLEIYISADAAQNKTMLSQCLMNFNNLDINDFAKYIDYFEGQDAIQHITKVATGIDSLVMGESQILGQLKNAYNLSKKHNFLDKILEKLFQHVFAIAKKIRNTTGIGQNSLSIAYCGIQLSQKIFTDISQQTALLIGSGEMIQLSAKYLSQKNVKNIIMINRTLPKVQKIIDGIANIRAQAFSLQYLNQHFHRADIIITSTEAPIAIIGKGMVESSIIKRKRKPIFILDLSVPRDVEQEVAKMDDVFLYTVDDIKQVVSKNKNARDEEKKIAIAKINILNKPFIDFINLINNQELVKKYYQQAHKIKSMLLAKALSNVTTDNTNKVITKLADQLTQKLIHNNLINIKTLSGEQIKQCENCIVTKNNTTTK